MNAPVQLQGRNPFDDPLDRILAEIALSAQLPPSLHRQAGGRYGAVRKHLEADPGFEGHIEHFYPQGSMAIDATISNRGTDDEYDLDIISQLGGRFRTPLSGFGFPLTRDWKEPSLTPTFGVVATKSQPLVLVFHRMDSTIL